MSLIEAILLGLVEALTEFLPVSSTGHLILVGELIDTSEFSKAFHVIIQAGAMLAVVWYYRKLLWNMLRGIIEKKPEETKLAINLLVAFLPAVIIGLLVHKQIKAHLFGVEPVIWALLVGGIVLVIFERKFKKNITSLRFSKRHAFVIGLFQCLAMWPGTSRSMATILGGRFMGLSPQKAAEFSFLLAIPTILGASIFDLSKNYDLIFAGTNPMLILVGTIVSFVASLFVIKWFLNFLANHSLAVFGWYRIFIAIVITLLIII